MQKLNYYILEKLKINKDSKVPEIKSKYGFNENELIDKILYLFNNVQDNIIPVNLENDFVDWILKNKYNRVELYVSLFVKSKKDVKIIDIIKEIQITNTFIDNDVFTAFFNKRAKNNSITKNNITYCISDYNFLVKFNGLGICIKGFKK